MAKYRYFSLALIVSALVLMTGCGSSVQLEDRNYVMALGLDYENGKLKASFSFPDLEALTGKGGNIHYPVTTISGDNMASIERQYERGANRRLDYGQLQVIVLGSSMFENRPVFETVLAYMKTRQGFTRTILVCRAENTAAEIIGLDEAVNGSIGIYIREMFENNGLKAGYAQTIINDLMVAWKNNNEAVCLAVLRADNEKRPEICGSFWWPQRL